ncbi:hypothetical protein M0D21_10965 [Aquimarina sp. D1M17]|uniref:hypothetical protein n=1 Tax=Aquimarina acroporae TaxID=2937283 RepID=UPI0020BDEDC0|nr:hypothetical protein [Aquimarina acroporae]MCK8522092.1 hypothetical protein [Aquimarina acroporae]
MQKCFFYLVLCTLFTITGCSNDDDTSGNPFIPTNLAAVLSLESNGISVNEGKPFIINLNLSKAFSEDLILEGIFTNTNKATYINDDDLKKEFEYSTDGVNWLSESNKLQIKFPKGKQSLKVRMQTNDDQNKEILFEDVELAFSNKSPNLDIGKEDLNIKLSIKDNDDPEETQEGALMEFVFDENNDYTLKAVTNGLLSSEFTTLKEVVDGGYKKIMDDVKYVNSILPAENKIKTFLLLFLENSGLGGFVFNGQDQNTIQGNINEWTMGMNLAFAFFEGGENGISTIKYNENGIYGYILAHEAGHIITLARKLQFDATIEEANCNNLFISEGCALNDAHLNKFNNSFYIPTAPEYEEPKYVTEYAKTNIAEDIAEVVATYVTQENLPNLNTKSSGALHKMHQLFGENEFINFRENFRKNIKVGFGLGSSPIEKSGINNEVVFNRYDGKRVPCKHVKDLMRKEIRKKIKSFE